MSFGLKNIWKGITILIIKKSMCIVSALLITVSLGSAVDGNEVKAKEIEKPKVVYSSKEVKDIDRLYEMAKNGETDQEKDLESKVAMKGNVTSGDGLNVENLSTSQLLKVTKEGDKTTETYATTGFAVTHTPSGDFGVQDTSNRSKWDESIGVKAYSTVYYNIEFDRNKKDYLKFTKITGGWTVQDKSISLSNRKLVYGANGSANGSSWITQTSSITPSKNSFSVNVVKKHPKWKAVTDITDGSSLGGNSTVKLKRRSSTWTLQLTNNAF